MLRLSRLILAREGRGNKNASITSPPESDFFRWCDNAEDEVNIFDWEPVEEIIQERIQQFKKDAENMKLQVNINDIESTKILVEDDDGDECEYEVSDIAVFSVDKKRNEYCLDMIEYPDLLKPVEKVLHATFGNTIQISKDQRKKKLFCRQPKVNGVVRRSRINTLKAHRNFCQMEVAKILSAMVTNIESDIKNDDELRTNKDTPHFVKDVKAFTKYYKEKQLPPVLNQIELKHGQRLSNE